MAYATESGHAAGTATPVSSEFQAVAGSGWANTSPYTMTFISVFAISLQTSRDWFRQLPLEYHWNMLSRQRHRKRSIPR